MKPFLGLLELCILQHSSSRPRKCFCLSARAMHLAALVQWKWPMWKRTCHAVIKTQPAYCILVLRTCSQALHANTRLQSLVPWCWNQKHPRMISTTGGLTKVSLYCLSLSHCQAPCSQNVKLNGCIWNFDSTSLSAATSTSGYRSGDCYYCRMAVLALLLLRC